MKIIISLLLMSLLSACGGGGGSAAPATETPTQSPIEQPVTPPPVIEPELAADQPNNSPPNIWKGGLKKIYEPAGQIKGYFIVHQGHSSWDGSSPSGREYDHPEYDLTILSHALADAGYRVYAFEMPPLPHNMGPVERFYQPVINLLDKIAGDGQPIYMAGLSGGGWTTTHVTALDVRITKGYSIQGDAPFDLRPISLPEWDEETNPKYDYRVLYGMAGDRLTHMYGGAWKGYEGDIGYKYVNDPEVKDHSVSWWTINYILGDINVHSNPQAATSN